MDHAKIIATTLQTLLPMFRCVVPNLIEVVLELPSPKRLGAMIEFVVETYEEKVSLDTQGCREKFATLIKDSLKSQSYPEEELETWVIFTMIRGKKLILAN